MNITPKQNKAFSHYQAALENFQQHRFSIANKYAREYIRMVNYGLFEHYDNRGRELVSASVIIVSRNRGNDLLACLDSLEKQSEPGFEIIVADNGGNEDVRQELLAKDLLLVTPPPVPDPFRSQKRCRPFRPLSTAHFSGRRRPG